MTREIIISSLSKKGFDFSSPEDENCIVVLICINKSEDFETLRKLRKASKEKIIFAIMSYKFSHQGDPVDMGADLLLNEPVDFEELSIKLSILFAALEFDRNYKPGRLSLLNSLVEGAVKEIRRNEDLSLELLYKLDKVATLRDDSTHDHTQRVGDLSRLIAEELNLDPSKIFEIRMTAPLHDIGKIGIPDSILFKKGPLNEEEWKIMKTHTQIGADILKSENTLLQCAERIALFHHEKYDGTGYLKRLKGDEIPIEARIVSVADAFDAMVSKRPYKDERTIQDAIGEIISKAGTQFDPAIVNKFLLISERVERLYLDLKKYE
jgi:putative two-component system response regulator